MGELKEIIRDVLGLNFHDRRTITVNVACPKCKTLIPCEVSLRCPTYPYCEPVIVDELICPNCGTRFAVDCCGNVILVYD